MRMIIGVAEWWPLKDVHVLEYGTLQNPPADGILQMWSWDGEIIPKSEIGRNSELGNAMKAEHQRDVA